MKHDPGLSRRGFVLALALFPALVSRRAQAAAGPEGLMRDDVLPDLWIGNPDAKISIIEYASMTCSHCAAFHNGTFKELKTKYIDTGKARFTVREFPFDPLAMAGFMLARCQGPEKREAMIELLFAQQTAWVNDKPLEGLTKLTRQAGMGEAAFKACLDDKKLYEDIGQIRDRGQQKFSVTSTPTFFINGAKLQGYQILSELETAMAPFLK